MPWWEARHADGWIAGRNRDGVCGKDGVMGPSFEVVFEAEFPALHRYPCWWVGASRGLMI